jgi:ribose transport system substrate-binding protein
MKKWMIAVAVLSIGVFLAACGSDSGSSSTGETSSGGDTTTETTAQVEFKSATESGLPVGYPEPAGDEELTIGWPGPTSASEGVASVERSMKATISELGGKMIALDAERDVDKQITDIQQLIAQKVDAIVVYPIDAGAVLPAVEQAKKAGIPVVAIEYNSKEPENVAPFDTQVLFGNERAAYEQVRTAAEMLPEGAKVVQIGFPLPVPTIVAITTATKEWAKAFGLDLLGRADNPTDDIAGGEEAMTGLLAEYPDAEAVLTYNDASAIGAAAAARSQGKEMLFFGNTGASDGITAVENGRIDSTVVSDRAGVGKYAVWGAYDLVEDPNAKLPKTVLTGPPVAVTAENVSEFSTD